MPRARVASSLVAVALLAPALASCGGSGLAQINSSWVLQSVTDHSLPDTLPNTDPQVVITSGTSQTNSDGSYSFTFTGTSGGAAGAVGSDHGTWTITSSTFLFRSALPGVVPYIAALSPTSFRVDLPGQLVQSSSQTVNMVFTESP